MATKANVALITSIPEQYFEKLEKAVTENFVQGVRYEHLQSVVERIADVTESRAKLIARDQTSKMNSAFNKERQTSVGIQKYEWQTMEDERVCDECGPLDGLTREQIEDEEPPIHPRCRCFWRIMPKTWRDLADRDLAHQMDLAGVVPDGMYIHGADGELKAVVTVSFNKWAEDKMIALGTQN